MRETLTCVFAAVILVVVGISAWELNSLHEELTTVHREVTALKITLRQQRSRSTSSPRPAAHRRVARSRRTRPFSSRNHQVVVRVDGLNYAFAPSVIRVKLGSRVTWKNETAEPHTVTSFQRGLFDTSLNPHKSAVLLFRRSGTYRYYCGYHPYMRGEIVVRR